jgi:putative thioredoxin
MTAAPFIVDVNRNNFVAVVLDNSHRWPVLVDFWADWCQPCQMLMPLLKRLVDEYNGGFLLAKVNTDQEQELAMQCGVRSLPIIKVFRNGEMVDELIGVQPEAVFRQVIERHRVKPVEVLLQQAELLWQRGDQAHTLQLLRKAQSLEPDNPAIKVALADKLLATGEAEVAAELLHSLPADVRAEEPANGLLARLAFMDLVKDAPDLATLIQAVKTQPDDCARRRQLGARQLLAGDYAGALEQFLEILRRNPGFDEQAGRKGLLAIFNILGSGHPLVATYRRRMATLLY